MDLNEGLYDRVITQKLVDEIENLSAQLLTARYEDLSKEEVAERVSEIVRDWIYQIVDSSKEDTESISQQLLLEISQILESYSKTDITITGKPIFPLKILTAIERISPQSGNPVSINEPLTPLRSTTLHTNERGSLRIGSLIKNEIDSADEIDVILAFIRYSGIRDLVPAFEQHIENGGRLRVLTTTYTNSTEGKALEKLVSIGAEVKVSYNTTNTRLHAKGWHFKRNSGLSTVYIGSSNLTISGQITGREWNVKLSEAVNSEVIEEFDRTFTRCWESREFELFDLERFNDATKYFEEDDATTLSPFNIQPYDFQRDILEKLQVDRLGGFSNNLVVAATGTGKTIVSAFDYKQLNEDLNHPRLLFVAHRKEIIEQSRNVFRNVLKKASFGELWVGGKSPEKWNHVFASIQSITRNGLESIEPNHFDVIIIDEFHHAGAKTYTELLNHMKPKFLLGLTATPERMDGLDILKWFGNRISYELRIWDALEEELIAPFHYYGIYDEQDLTQINWRNGKYDSSDLTNLYTANNLWSRKVISELLEKHGDIRSLKALGFCVTIKHANFMAEQFNLTGITSAAVTSATDSKEREKLKADFQKGKIKVLFTVDLFNEGVDIPDVNVILMLRPTESATIFLQQLGRGLRKSETKELVTVLDFVGHHNKEFRFDLRFRKLLGRTRRELESDIENDFPFLPSGCHFELEEKAKEIVLNNIKNALPSTWKNRISELRELGDVSLRTYLDETGLDLHEFYSLKNKTWTALKREAGLLPRTSEENKEKVIGRSISRFLHIDDIERFETFNRILSLQSLEEVASFQTREDRQIQGLLLGVLPAQGKYGRLYPDIQSALQELLGFADLRKEFIEVLEILQENQIHSLGKPLTKNSEIPLKLHSRYSRDEILAAYGESTINVRHNLVAGVLFNKEYETDLFFITLKKEDKDFLPTHKYADYPINEHQFHWESQATTTRSSSTGQRYINHQTKGSKIALFIREAKKDSLGNTMPYFAAGYANYNSSKEERPIQITWQLEHPLPGRALTSFKEAVA